MEKCDSVEEVRRADAMMMPAMAPRGNPSIEGAPGVWTAAEGEETSQSGEGEEEAEGQRGVGVQEEDAQLTQWEGAQEHGGG